MTPPSPAPAGPSTIHLAGNRQTMRSGEPRNAGQAEPGIRIAQ